MTRWRRGSARCRSGAIRNVLCVARLNPGLNRRGQTSRSLLRGCRSARMSEVHFEIFCRKGSKGGWTMHDVSTDRASALKEAERVMAEHLATGVKVVKETYNATTGDYLSLKIFEDGLNKLKSDPAQEE